MKIEKIRELLSHVTCDIMGTKLHLTTNYDKRYGSDKTGRRVYIQIFYHAPCSKTGEMSSWKGRKHYLSSFMTEDEVIKTAFLAFELAIRHEILEGFRFDSMPVFNPHTSFREILKVSPKEDKRIEGKANFDI